MPTPAPHQTKAGRLTERDVYLKPYEPVIARRHAMIDAARDRLTRSRASLAEFAAGHEFFGLHYTNGEWVLREWAPNATAIFLVGTMSGWRELSEYALEKSGADGTWQIHLPADKLNHQDLYRLKVYWPGGSGDRIPAYARRVVQDSHSQIFNAQVWLPAQPYRWQHTDFRRSQEPPLIYEAHVGMAQEDEKVGSYREFADHILPRIVAAGYNTLQLMAIQEHPYYGSFGYQVSSFFAASSRFGPPEDLKALVDAAHGAGLTVLMDLVHSHAASNEVEGLSRFDGTLFQYFHDGPRGRHPAWDSRCFDYGKDQVLHFLLSNCRFWLDEYRFDGFRFDGITSMIYLHHGLAKPFLSYDDYFDDSVDENALVYLALANQLVHEVRPDAITVAEDVSGMPGLAVPDHRGGFGFDYRFAMGIPDFWIKLCKEYRDEDWPMGQMWHEMTNRRPDENTISYAESHDQALVGDQTLIFRLIGADMYRHMRRGDDHLIVDRGMALHKLIRLATMATAGSGFLNFMGNEFGHPEWIDFPRQGNQWSYRYARRQWHLVDDENLKYRLLAEFDRDLVSLVKKHRWLADPMVERVYEHDADKILAARRGELLFVFNFHPVQSYTDYRVDAATGRYGLVFDTDEADYGGHGRLAPQQRHHTITEGSRTFLSLYLPARTGQVLEMIID